MAATPRPTGARLCQDSEVTRRIVEREHEVAELASAVREAADGVGSVVLVFGEAGIGKSSLVQAVRGLLPAEGRMLVGYCDDLATPRPLGPFRDLIGGVGTELARALEQGGDRNRVLDALRSELNWAGHPTVLAIEDVHWADDATLDALRYLTRRVADLPAVLLLTYRDDELTRDHPLRHLLGQVARADRLRRVPLSRLSEGAVRQLSATSPLDPRVVFSVTSGNPFFVAEVLAAGDTGAVPPTIVDAVLARIRGLDARAQDALEQLAVVPSALDWSLVDELVPGGVAALATAEQRGLLSVTPTRVGFRHELIRRTVADSLPAPRRVELNRRVLAALAKADWDRATSAAEVGLDAQPPSRCPALTVLGRVRIRRGQPGGDELLSQAWQLAVQLQELQRRGPVAAARAEAAWLRGDDAAVVAAVEDVYDDARRVGDARLVAELDYWLTKAGRTVTPIRSDHPYALQAAGLWREAAEVWRAAGCPYEHAAALAESPRHEDVLDALAELDALGAEPLARVGPPPTACTRRHAYPTGPGRCHPEESGRAHPAPAGGAAAARRRAHQPRNRRAARGIRTHGRQPRRRRARKARRPYPPGRREAGRRTRLLEVNVGARSAGFGSADAAAFIAGGL